MDPVASKLLESYPVVIQLPVQWGDQDAFGHVNNCIYIRWFESARIAYADRTGLTSLMSAQKIGPILAAVACNFRRQLNFPDTVEIGARISRLGRSSMTMEHLIVSQSQQSAVADGDSTIVCFDYASNKPIAIPDPIRQAVEQLEGKTF